MKTELKRNVGILLLITAIYFIFFYSIFKGNYPGPIADVFTDITFSFEPYKLALVESIKNGELFFWSDKASLGSPVTSVLAMGVLHPFHLFNFIVDAPLAYSLGLIARLIIFTFFLALYLKLIGIRDWIAITFAIALATGNCYLNWMQQIIGYTVCFFPMIFYFIEKYLKEEKLSSLAMISFTVVLMTLGSFLPVLLFCLIVAGFYIVFLPTVRSTKIKLLLAIALGLLILFPILEETFHFFKDGSYDKKYRENKFEHTGIPFSVTSVFFNSIYGSLTEQYNHYKIPDFFSTKYGAGLLTPFVLLVLFFNPFKEKNILFNRYILWVFILIFSVILYFNFFNVKYIVKLIPFFNEQVYTRLNVIISMALAVIAAITLENFFKNNTLKLKKYQIVGLLTYTLIIITIYLNYRTPHSSLIVKLAVLLVILFVLTIKKPKVLAISLGGLILVSSFLSTKIYVADYKKEEFYPTSPAIEFMKKNLKPGARVLDVQNASMGMKHAAYGISSLTGHQFTPSVIRGEIQTAQLDGGVCRFNYCTVNKFDNLNSFVMLKKFHTQFIALPNNDDYIWTEESNTNFKTVYKDAHLKILELNWEENSLNGVGYENFKQKNGLIKLRVIKANETVTLPIRSYRGWLTTSGANILPADDSKLIKIVTAQDNLEVKLCYYPMYFQKISAFLMHDLQEQCSKQD